MLTTTPDAKCHVDDLAFAYLNVTCRLVKEAYNAPMFIMGSSLRGIGWRDVDVRCIMPVDQFKRLFPMCYKNYKHRTSDRFWTISCISITALLRQSTGLPIDFQFVAEDLAERWNDKECLSIGD